MAVRIRMKKMGRRHRPFFRICVVDSRAPRDGKVIEEIGHYDPMVAEKDARVQINGERVAHWISVGAQPSESVSTFIKKYGLEGTHLEQQRAAQERLLAARPMTPAPSIRTEEAEAAEETTEVAEAVEEVTAETTETESEG